MRANEYPSTISNVRRRSRSPYERLPDAAIMWAKELEMLYPKSARALPFAFATLLLTAAFIIQGRAGSLPKEVFLEFQKGTESSLGSFDDKSGIVHGNTFTLNSFDAGESRHLTVVIDYANNGYAPTNLPIVGGSWTLVIVRKGEYYRTIYGSVASGEIVGLANLCPDPPAAPPAKNLVAQLHTTGVLGDYDMPFFSSAHLELSSDAINASGFMELNY